jgi:ferric-dicitrate binding protein FerR (iron transport regulator)
MQPEEIQALIRKYLNGTATPEEQQLLDRWYQEGQLDPAEWFAEAENEEELLRLEMLGEIRNRIGLQPDKSTIRLWPRIAAAASILIAVSAGGYFLLHKKDPVQQFTQNQKQDIKPGTNKAILTLGNGQHIVLNNQTRGVIANQSNVQITKTDSGKLAYSAGANAAVAMNTLETPRGGTYYVLLSDGTKVWLNAASKIVYPSVFKGNERVVTLTGEAYFEVEHNAKMPFKVKVNDQVVEDLGTHFNIKAYSDEGAIKTTLFEGGVKVSDNGRSLVLKPGQQAADLNLVKNPDLDQAIAWHKGLFEFNNADIPTIMKELARWYDVEITYEGDIPERHFTGKLYRNVNALKIADILNYNNIHFRIEGKKIIVTP